MPTRNVVLTDHQSDLIDRLVASGRFQNASEAMRAGLRLLEVVEERLASMEARLKTRLAQAEAGDFAEGSLEEVVDRALRAAMDRVDADPTP